MQPSQFRPLHAVLDEGSRPNQSLLIGKYIIRFIVSLMILALKLKRDLRFQPCRRSRQTDAQCDFFESPFTVPTHRLSAPA